MSEEKTDAANSTGLQPGGASGTVREIASLDLDESTPAGFSTEFTAEIPWDGKQGLIRLTTEAWEKAGTEFREFTKKPVMPYTWEIIDDPQHLARLSWDKPGAIKAYDPADKDYLEQLKDYNGDYNRYVVAASMVTPLRLKGEELTDTKKKAEALKDKGMGDQMATDLSQMCVDKSKARVKSLTAFTEGT